MAGLVVTIVRIVLEALIRGLEGEQYSTRLLCKGDR